MSTNRQHQQEMNEEESTIFRSIPMGGSSTASMRPLAPPPMMKPLGGLRPLGPPGKFSSPLPSISKPAPVDAAPSSTSTTKKNSINWKVNEETIPSVPDYPLERTNMTCSASTTIDQITERIARVLEAHNLECAYHDDDDDDSSSSSDYDDEEILPGRLDCTSSDNNLKFVVQLWRSHTNEIIVEMQRRRGSSIEFSSIRKPLFQTLQTGTVPAKKKSFAPPSGTGSFVPNKKFRVLPPSMSALPPLKLAA